ncbi:MAG TPA: MAPEG family protein [Caulobacteraceae bacterium]|nr:MAPEG family protein [Caulobacteraceae bacterium]
MQTVTLPVISAISAGVLIIGQMGLMLAIAARRRATRQALGEGDAALQRLVRRHGNYAENAAIFVASLALLEMMGAARPFVIGLAALFILGRLLHAIGLSRQNTVNVWRIAGIFATVGVGVTLGVRLVILGIGHLG